MGSVFKGGDSGVQISVINFVSRACTQENAKVHSDDLGGEVEQVVQLKAALAPPLEAANVGLNHNYANICFMHASHEVK